MIFSQILKCSIMCKNDKRYKRCSTSKNKVNSTSSTMSTNVSEGVKYIDKRSINTSINSYVDYYSEECTCSINKTIKRLLTEKNLLLSMVKSFFN